MKESYRTVRYEGEAELVEKRSRFIASVRPVKTEEEALEFLEDIKKRHWDARHNVYAYVLEENNIQRYSDDGEPAGTAGLPVLDMIKKEGLSDIVVVVTRYFGGILLGTGGLVHAYSKSAKMGIESAEPVTMMLCCEAQIECDYSLWGKLESVIAGRGLPMGEIDYSDKVTAAVFVPDADVSAFSAELVDMSNGKIGIELGEKRHIMV